MVPISRRLGVAQTKWIERVEKRLSVTSSTLKDIKSFKMLGLIDVLGKMISNLRSLEVGTSLQFRKLMIWEIAFCKFDTLSLEQFGRY